MHNLLTQQTVAKPHAPLGLPPNFAQAVTGVQTPERPPSSWHGAQALVSDVVESGLRMYGLGRALKNKANGFTALLMFDRPNAFCLNCGQSKWSST